MDARPYKEPQAPLFPGPPPQKPKTWPLWAKIAIVPGILLLFLVGIVAISLFFVLTSSEKPLSATERELLLDIDDITPLVPGFEPLRSREKAVKIEYLGGVYDLEYEYNDTNNLDAIYLNYTVTFEQRASDALASYQTMSAGGELAMRMVSGGSLRLDERNDLFSWGDRSKFSIINVDGLPAGNTFFAQKNRNVVQFIVTGIYFDDAEMISDLLEGHLAKLDSYLH